MSFFQEKYSKSLVKMIFIFKVNIWRNVGRQMKIDQKKFSEKAEHCVRHIVRQIDGC